jgi:hypothetical protein
MARKKTKAIVLRSKLEERVKEQLDARKITYKYEPGTYTYISPVRSGVCASCGGNKVGKRRRYLPDFVVPDWTDGVITGGIIIEVKGYLTSSERTKLLDIARANPEVDLRLLFGSDNKLSKTSNTRYSDWAREHGFPSAIRTIPDEWFKEFNRGRPEA